MKPNKIYWYLGASGLATIMEQERKHWLLKTDKTKSVQDPFSGDQFIGTIDNLGSQILIETEKTSTEDSVVRDATFSSENVANVLSLENSVFGHISEMNGLKFARLKSINLSISDVYHNFRLALNNCTVVYMPMSLNTDTGSIFVYKWYMTTDSPVLQCLDDNDEYTINVPVTFSSGVTNPVFYYPCEEVIQPFSLTSNSDTTCQTILITDPLAIGYPLFWFTCDESNLGPSVTLGNIATDQTNPRSRLFEIGHVGNMNRYTAFIYPCTGNIDYSTPTTTIEDWSIRCSPASGTFDGTALDFNKPISSIEFYSLSDTELISVTNTGSNIIRMVQDVGWQYDENTGKYFVPVASFESNLYENHGSLTPAFEISLDTTIPFESVNTDAGFVGVQMSSLKNDNGSRYPHDIQNLKGLPDWIRSNTNIGVAQHMAIYALHNTPTYQPEDQTTRQIAGLIFDPGVERSYPETEETAAISIGRVYLLSNDDITYENNATAEHPKPARTIARICDIPTSVMQLSNISGLAPTSVVDKQYVRSEASYSETDKNRLYNGLRDKWVRPTHLNRDGQPVYTEDSETQSNPFIFDSLENLESIDMMVHNDFRWISNLNPMVDPQDVSIHTITARGSGYAVSDMGVIVIGGFSFNYVVNAVDDDGGVTDVGIAPSDNTPINLSNFNLYSEEYGLTAPYGTSPLGDSTGTGLKLSFYIQNFDQLLPIKGNVVDGLCAFVREADGIWLYQYIVTSTNSHWEKQSLFATANDSTTISKDGNVSEKHAYINAILPSIREFTVSEAVSNDVNITAFTTATSINVIDQTTIPIDIPNESKTVIDINKFYSRGLFKLTADQKNTQSVISAINRANFNRYDTYIAWRWIDDDPTNCEFEFTVIHRSLNNLLSQTDTSLIPESFDQNNFIHTNSQTTITWNVDQVGPMVWMYDPYSDTHETYYVNAESRDVCITKTKFDWSTIDTTTITHEKINLTDDSGHLLFNILTNNPIILGLSVQDSIYDMRYRTVQDLVIGNIPVHQPRGSWRLVFPEVHAFSFKDMNNESVSVTPVKMQILRGSNIQSFGNVLNDFDKPVNYKTLILNDRTDLNRTVLNLYNQETGQWNTI